MFAYRDLLISVSIFFGGNRTRMRRIERVRTDFFVRYLAWCFDVVFLLDSIPYFYSGLFKVSGSKFKWSIATSSIKLSGLLLIVNDL